MKDFRVDHLKKSYGAKSLLEDVSFIINEGEHVGLIGQNGTGKSTLLSILAGVDFAESGDITTSNDFRIGYLSQQPELEDEDTIFEALYKGDHPTLKVVHDFEEVVEQLRENPTSESLAKRYSVLEQKMNEIDGWQVEVQIKTILQKMGLTDIQKKVGTLSGGQKKRVGLAKVLMEEPDLLLLDEPTNHLDLEAIEWLEGYLANYKGAMMLVTHDRYFLERAVTHMFELVNGRIEAYEGNFESYLEQRSQREQIATRMSQKQKRLYQSELEWMRQGAKARTTKQQARIHRFEALEKDVKQTTSQEKLVMEFDQARIGKRVFQLEDAFLSINGQSIVKNLDWVIQSQARIGIAGVNGVGKSTFLNAIAGQIPFDSGQFVVGETVRIAYYKQEDEDIPMDKQLIQYLREEAEEIKRKNGEVASISELLETFLFPRHLHGAYIHTLSGGERRRLYLLRLLMTKPNVLLLDEPTNDLDIDTLTVLEDFLESFNGAVLIVSHDRYFLDKTVDQLFVIRGEGQTELFYGSMSEYLDREKTLAKVVVEAPKVEEAKVEAPKATTPKRMTYQEKKEWETIEGTIQELEERLEFLQEEMSVHAQDFAKLQELQEELDKTEEAASEAYERWEYLAEISRELKKGTDMTKQYKDLLRKILEEGTIKTDRTGTGTKSVFGYQMRFDLQKGFPLLTTKRVAFGLIKSELLWFLHGDTNIKYLLEHNNHIWDEWAFERYVSSPKYTGPDMTDFGRRCLQDEAFNEVYQEVKKDFCEKILTDDAFAAEFGELGNIYGSQWRHWKTTKGETIDQIADLLNLLKNSPDSRRMIVSAWNPEDVPSMALPPCHTMFQFYVADGKLSCQLYQRSADVFLGVPFNIASYALLTHLIANEVGLEVGEFVHTLGDAHIYLNHMEQVETQLAREERELPTLVLKHPEKSMFEIDVDDVIVEGYNPHPTIKAPIAV